MRQFQSKKILNKSLQPKLKGASVCPLMHAMKWLQADYVIYDHQKKSSGTVKRKFIKVNCSDNWGNFYVLRAGRGGF